MIDIDKIINKREIQATLEGFFALETSKNIEISEVNSKGENEQTKMVFVRLPENLGRLILQRKRIEIG